MKLTNIIVLVFLSATVWWTHKNYCMYYGMTEKNKVDYREHCCWWL